MQFLHGNFATIPVGDLGQPLWTVDLGVLFMGDGTANHAVLMVDAQQAVTGAKTFGAGTFVLAGSTSGTITLNAAAVAGANTLTLPAATDTLVGRDTTDTLTNKTLAAPEVTGAITILTAATYGSDQTPLQTLAPSFGPFSVSGSNMGWKFTANADGRVTKLWMKVNDSSSHVVRLYRIDGTLIASGTISSSGDTWVSVAITPVQLSSGDTYIVSAYFDTTRSHASFTFPQTSGDITIVEGRYLDGSTAMPTTVDTGGLHGVDITFEPATVDSPIITTIPDYGSNAAAITAGLAAGSFYRKGDNVCVVH